MSRLTGRDAFGLVEAYNAVYASQGVDEDQLASEIFEEIAYALISQGYTAIDVLEYFANVDEEVIIEDIVAIDEGTLLIESVVSEEYIEEQMQQLDEVWGLAARVAAPLVARAAPVIARAAPRVAGAAAKLGQRAAGAATRLGQRASTAAWKSGSKATPMGRFPAGTPTAPGTKIIGQKNLLQRAGSAVSGAVNTVKSAAKGALGKLPGGSGGKLASAARTAGKWALGGAAFEAGTRGVSALMSKGGGGSATGKSTPTPDANKAKYTASAGAGGQTAFAAGGGAAAMKKDPKLTAADVQKRGTAAMRASAGGDLAKGSQLFKSKQQIMSGKPTGSAPAAASASPSGGGGGGSAAPSGGGGGGATRPSASAPSGKATPTTPAPGTKAAGPESIKPKTPNPLMQRTFGYQSGNAPDQVQKRAANLDTGKITRTAFAGSTPPLSSAAATAATTKPVDDVTKKQRQIASTPRPVTANPSGKRDEPLWEEVDAFDLVLEYLVSEGYAETEEAATAIMANMSEEWREEIICEKKGERPRGLPYGPVGKGFRELTVPQRKKMLEKGKKHTRAAMGSGEEYSGSHAKSSAIDSALRSKRLGGRG